MSLTAQENEQFLKVFRLFDQDENGVITPDEIKFAMERYGETPTQQNIDDILFFCNQHMNESNFIKAMALPLSDRSSDEQDKKAAFQCFDNDCDGFLSKQDVITAMAKYFGDNLSQEDIDDLFKEIDRDQDGKLSFTEFSRTC